jgi:hypothetical protein
MPVGGLPGNVSRNSPLPEPLVPVAGNQGKAPASVVEDPERLEQHRQGQRAADRSNQTRVRAASAEIDASSATKRKAASPLSASPELSDDGSAVGDQPVDTAAVRAALSKTVRDKVDQFLNQRKYKKARSSVLVARFDDATKEIYDRAIMKVLAKMDGPTIGHRIDSPEYIAHCRDEIWALGTSEMEDEEVHGANAFRDYLNDEMEESRERATMRAALPETALEKIDEFLNQRMRETHPEGHVAGAAESAKKENDSSAIIKALFEMQDTAVDHTVDLLQHVASCDDGIWAQATEEIEPAYVNLANDFRKYLKREMESPSARDRGTEAAHAAVADNSAGGGNRADVAAMRDKLPRAALDKIEVFLNQYERKQRPGKAPGGPLSEETKVLWRSEIIKVLDRMYGPVINHPIDPPEHIANCDDQTWQRCIGTRPSHYVAIVNSFRSYLKREIAHSPERGQGTESARPTLESALIKMKEENPWLVLPATADQTTFFGRPAKNKWDDLAEHARVWLEGEYFKSIGADTKACPLIIQGHPTVPAIRKLFTHYGSFSALAAEMVDLMPGLQNDKGPSAAEMRRFFTKLAADFGSASNHLRDAFKLLTGGKVEEAEQINHFDEVSKRVPREKVEQVQRYMDRLAGERARGSGNTLTDGEKQRRFEAIIRSLDLLQANGMSIDEDDIVNYHGNSVKLKVKDYGNLKPYFDEYRAYLRSSRAPLQPRQLAARKL